MSKPKKSSTVAKNGVAKTTPTATEEVVIEKEIIEEVAEGTEEAVIDSGEGQADIKDETESTELVTKESIEDTESATEDTGDEDTEGVIAYEYIGLGSYNYKNTEYKKGSILKCASEDWFNTHLEAFKSDWKKV